MKKTIQKTFAVVLMALSTMPAMAQLNGTGYYRVRNAQYTDNYISIANDKLVYSTIVSSGGGAKNLALSTSQYAPYAFNCVAAYLKNDIHLNATDFIDPSTIIYAKKILTNDYNLIGQGTSLLTLTTGMYNGTNGQVYFKDLNVTISKVSGSGSSTLYTASILLKARAVVPIFGSMTKELGTRYFVDNDGTFGIDESSSNTNAKWYIEPVTYFNVMPEVEFNGKYYTTLKVPFECTLSGQIEKAYVITAVNNGVLEYNEIATTGGNIPVGTAVILECASPNAADCQLIPVGMPTFPTPVEDATSAPKADEDDSYVLAGNTNLLKGTYFCNTDGQIPYVNYKEETKYLNGDHITSATNPDKYVLGITESGKLGFVKATGTAMPANKAWLETAGEFPWEVPADVLRGDVNDDNEVSIKDVSALIDYLLSNDATGINLTNADMNEDEEVSIKDVSALIDYLLNSAE